jgi:hypothetical protein
MSWFNNDSAFKSETSDKVRRFWMKNGTDREITFVDPATINFNGQQIPTPIQYMEYNLNMNGHWRNWFTRPTDDSQDFLKELGHRASKVAALTVIDHSEWTDRKGNVHKDEVLMYVVKRSSTVWKQIERFYSTHGSLQGQRFRISRMGDKSPGAGSLLEHIGQSEVYNPEIHKPYDYFEVLKPKTRDELIKITSPDEDDFNGQSQQAAWGGQPAPQQPPQQSAWANYNAQPIQQPPQPPQQLGWGASQPTQQQQPPQQYGYVKDDQSGNIPF